MVDRANLLSPTVEQKLNLLLRQFHQQGKAQIALLTVPSLRGETIESLSLQVAEKWKLGDAKKDNGILLLLAHKERRIRIEVGQGLEGQLTDAHSKRILDERIFPLFKKGNLEQGLEQGVLAILQHIDPSKGNLVEGDTHRGRRSLFRKGLSKTAPPSPRQKLISRIVSLIFLILLFILFITRPRLFFLLLMGMMMGGGRRGGFGGGGFGSYGGGGGGFSGGGASGSW